MQKTLKWGIMKMSQYTITINSLINIHSHFEPYNDDVFADVHKKFERAREMFFTFDYSGNDEFKNLFENAFLIEYLRRDIYTEDVELFTIALENEVKTKSRLYFPKWNIINNQLTEINNKLGVVESEGQNSTTNNNKSLASQFPQEIKSASDFGSVRHMDSGAMSRGDGTANSHFKSVEYNSKLLHMREVLELQSEDVIQEFVKSLSDLFMGVF